MLQDARIYWFVAGHIMHLLLHFGWCHVVATQHIGCSEALQWQ
jgi:hypothetical protein